MECSAVAVDGNEPVWRLTAGAFPSNCYIVSTGDGGCAVIDPGLDGAAIQRAVQQLGLTPRAVLCTHGHFDHTGSASTLQRVHGCAVYLAGADMQTLRASNFLLMAFKIAARVELPEVTPITAEATAVDVGARRFTFSPAPGHTPGSSVIRTGDALFTGDTLYAHGVGLSRLPGEQPEQLRHTLQALPGQFPSHCRVHPGHGASALLGWIWDNNTALQRFLAAATPVPEAP